jgi:hypothetical protein
MSKVFYDNLISAEEVILHFDSYTIDPEEKQELILLVDEIFHHHVLNIILNLLPKQHHPEFVKLLSENPNHPGLLIFIKSKINIDVVEEIKKHNERIKNDLINEIKKAKQRLTKTNKSS